MGRSGGIFWRQESTKFRKYSDLGVSERDEGVNRRTWAPRYFFGGGAASHQWLAWRTGDSFCAMWYKALIAFMLKRGGFLSAAG